MSGGPGALAASNAVQAFDPTQNYFLIFVDGRTYSGLAAGSVNPVGKTVTGALLGTQPEFSGVTNSNTITSVQQFLWPATVTTNVTNQSIVLSNDGTVTRTNLFFTNVVTSNAFSNAILTNSIALVRPDPLPLLNRGLSGAFQAKLKDNKAYMTFKGDGELSTPSQLQSVNVTTNARGEMIGGTIETDSIHFKVDGLRTSFTTISPAASTSATAAP